MISARVARESAKMHLRNMGCAWSSSIVSTCFLALCACFSALHGSQPKIEVPRRTLALPPVRRPDAPRDVGRSEARTLLSTAHTLANLSPDLGFEWRREAPRSGVGVLGWKVCDARSEKRRVARVGDSAHLFGSIELTFVHDRPVLVVGVGKNVKWCPPVHLFDLDRARTSVLDSPGGRAAHVTTSR